MSNFTCPICSNQNGKIITTHTMFEQTFHVVQCGNEPCQHGFISPLPSNTILDKIYSNENSNDAFLSTDEDIKNQLNHHKNIFSNVLNPLFKKPRSLLDLGAGIGTFVYAAQKENWDSSGLEFSKQAVSRGVEKFSIDLRVGNLYELENFFEKKSFDIISFIHVFEHIVDPSSYLNYVSKFLKDDGCIFLAVPNISSDDFVEQGSKWSYLHIPAHISYFNCESMDTLFLKNTKLENGYFEKVFQSTFPPKNMKQGEAVTALYRLKNN